MSVVKVIEVLAQSPTSFDDAVKVALDEAAKSVRGIESVYVKEMQAVVENNQITQYRINAKVSFTIGDA